MDGWMDLLTSQITSSQIQAFISLTLFALQIYLLTYVLIYDS